MTEAPDPDDPIQREKIRKALESEAGRRRWYRFIQTPDDLQRNAERLDTFLLVLLCIAVLVVIVLALCALNVVTNHPQAASAYGTLALVASGAVVGIFVLLLMHRARMRRAGWRRA
ncbi:hypothetical protein [Streptomyces olivochromogenes]|uniref:hypothetical protein n=1 Tax=Streptomyces olivochromogenes TaxID=1963 RepID=UPI001F47D0EA|nr:hypothetical protein [Streptomyces olivochromogenes]MCF3137448.1 hypothetical protein [Streptomyces olivochromogenes]